MKNITLKPLTDDATTAEEFFYLTDNNRQYLREFLPWLDFVKEVKDTQNFLTTNCQSDQLGTTLNYFICKNNAIIGTIGLREITSDSAIVGYWIDQSHSKQGITSYALQQVINIARNNNICKKLILRCNPNNIGSQKIAINNNFTYQQTLQEAEKLYSNYYDLQVYELIL